MIGQTIFQLNQSATYSHHEVAPSQHEIDLLYQDDLDMARNAMSDSDLLLHCHN